MRNLPFLQYAILLSTAVLAVEVTAQPITLTSAAGSTVNAYVTGHENAKSGIFIVHDWFGFSDFSRAFADRLGAQGYRVLAIDLYAGRSATTHAEAQLLMNDLFSKAPSEINTMLQTGLDYLETTTDKVATIGFSMGGEIALRATLLEPDSVDATIVIYGGGIENREVSDLARLKSQVLIVTGSKDSWAMSSLMAFIPKMDAANQSTEVYIYPGANHAYAQPLYASGANYNETATRVSWMVIDDFLERHLKNNKDDRIEG